MHCDHKANVLLKKSSASWNIQRKGSCRKKLGVKKKKKKKKTAHPRAVEKPEQDH